MAKKQPGKLIIVGIVMAVAVLGAVVWLVYQHSSGPSTVEVQQSQTSVEVKNGQSFEVNLASNPTTGYSWSLNEGYRTNIVELTNTSTAQPSNDAVGAPTIQTFTFKARSKGSTQLNFSYNRPWETNVAPAETKQLEVSVK